MSNLSLDDLEFSQEQTMNFRRRTILSTTLLIALTIPCFAQRAGRGFNIATGDVQAVQPQNPRDPTAAVQKALNLTASQVESLKALLQARMQAAQDVVTEIQEKRTAFESISSQSNPSPADLGNALLALRASQNKLQAIETKFQSDFTDLLTTDQKKLVDDAKAAAAILPALGAIGLVDGRPRAIGLRGAGPFGPGR